MFEFMIGTPEAMDAKGNVVFYNKAAGTGYSIRCLQRDWGHLSELDDVRLYVRAKFSDSNGYTLFGFRDVNDRTAFDLLTTVKGVAGAGSYAILELYNLGHLAGLIREGDAKSIAKAKGVGLRTANLIVAELKDKINDVEGGYVPVEPLREKAIDALTSLGYKRPEVIKAVAEVQAESVDAYVRKAIAKLM